MLLIHLNFTKFCDNDTTFAILLLTTICETTHEPCRGEQCSPVSETTSFALSAPCLAHFFTSYGVTFYATAHLHKFVTKPNLAAPNGRTLFAPTITLWLAMPQNRFALCEVGLYNDTVKAVQSFHSNTAFDLFFY